jgi:hypothetical protein
MLRKIKSSQHVELPKIKLGLDDSASENEELLIEDVSNPRGYNNRGLSDDNTNNTPVFPPIQM